MHSNSKERGMIFNGPMVKAILSGQKTQTRRTMKVQPVLNGSFYEVYGAGWSKGVKSVPVVNGHSLSNNCPFGAVGDRIWVRETFAKGLSTKSTLAFRATHKPEDLEDGFWETIKWTPSIHMPRWASRILLEITNVRVERLNDISEEDAQAQGVTPSAHAITPPEAVYRVGFSELWRSIYGDENWEKNPWVWVIEFKRVQEQSND
ncbi:MAG: hypothetical protein ACTID4_15000 [Hafnia alvei]|uniref:hypothetical protein n=1 Tax=Hafnia alvei TaxID=569 RepID=UPI003F91DFD0